jgi:hypothetical protein
MSCAGPIPSGYMHELSGAKVLLAATSMAAARVCLDIAVLTGHCYPAVRTDCDVWAATGGNCGCCWCPWTDHSSYIQGMLLLTLLSM